MRSTATLVIAAVLAAFGANAQIGYDSDNNVTSLLGTWSTGDGSVMTGSGPKGDICTPATNTFTYPKNTGMSYAFTEDGFFEEVQYRYDSNASNPNCIRGKILWQHGTYKLNDDGSMTLNPFGPDGRIQVQDPCAAVTNVVTYYNQETNFKDWGIVIDGQTGAYTLKLNRFDGAKLPPMYLTARPPNMLPTHTLVGTNATGQEAARRKRGFTSRVFQRSAATTELASTFGVAGSTLAVLAIVSLF